MKKVSVIIPVFNVEKFIAATIQSVLEQTYQNFELLIIDDGSPDRSVEICQQFKDSRIKIISQKNRGLAGARNTGIRHSEGEYLAFLDGDDIWLPEKLEKHIEHLENSPAVGVSFSRSATIDEASKPLGGYLMPKLKEIAIPYLLCCNPVGNGSAAVIRKVVFQAIEFLDNLHGTVENFYFDENFRRSEDIECWIRIAIQTDWQIEGIPEALTLYRINSGGLSADILKQLDSWAQVIDKTRSHFPESIEPWEKLTRSHHLRHAARSAVRLKAEGSLAVELINRALATYFSILFEEPRSTLAVVIGAYLLWLLPSWAYSSIEIFVANIREFIQQRQIIKEQTKQTVYFNN